MYGVIELFYQFQKYKSFTREDLFNYLIPVFNSGQYKIFYKDEKVTGFVSWAFLDDHRQDIFRKTGRILSYNCGTNLWVIDVVSSNDVKIQMGWIKNYFTQILGVNKHMNYLRVNEHNQIRMIKRQTTKEHYKWVV